jgi:S1-C subfamily serine protease
MNIKLISFTSIIAIAVSATTYFLIKENTRKTGIENSLIYLKSDAEKSLTGFVIGRKNNEYYVLTTKHIVDKSNRLRAIPYVLREERKVDPKDDFGANIVLTSNSDREIPTKLIKNLSEVDVSIISITTNQELSVLKLTQEFSEENNILTMNGFISCKNKQNGTYNQDFFYHKTSGKFFRKDDFKSVEGEKFLDLLKKGESEKEGVETLNETDMKYVIPSKSGMSGSPIIDSTGNVIGMQAASFNTDESLSSSSGGNCVISPPDVVSYGVSIKKILSSKDFPEDVRKVVMGN